eukprot:TRINITY_DN30526_c0_g1_i1.p1 TRINITY_DN30526_c0_g1~~TRINITY_DN30526_c0_g1_i1.p1  ORF type:complete len:613 (-),score=141.27 TRINITY_DN30526_c0_g1_i1:48-1886(-)
MSMQIQKQIKDNSTSVSEFFTDLYRWTEDQDKQERRRDIRRTAEKKGLKEAQKLAEATAKPRVEDAKEEQHDDKAKDAIKRDKTPMAQYYNDWDQYDPDAEVEKIEDEAFAQQKAEREERQAQQDRILDEMALKADGDRSRTSTARPRVKISVRRSGRKIAPVDLAAPRKEEANRLFSSGRYREAIASYSAGLDCLEKYEPPGSETVSSSATVDKTQDDDCAGQETEAIAIKVALLANRGLACLKLEEWRDCIADCSEALRFDPEHHKAILRRGFAQARLKRWGLAAKDLGHALAIDPEDKKASAELQMARRVLSEQAKEARARAKCVMCDPTRTAVMPTRRLQVKVHRGESTEEPVCAPQTSSQEAAVLSPSSQAAGAAEAPAEASSSSQGCQSRQAYVPRSVRLRGRQVSSSADKVGEHSAASGAAVSSKDATMPTLSFYQFEARWSRLRSNQCERAAFLRKIGAEHLPALFRESLDSELLASILEAIACDLAEATKSADASAFAVDVLGALSRTQRFELSIHSLTANERQVIDRVLDMISRCKPACSDKQLDILSAAFKPCREETADEEEELDEDDIAEDRQRSPIVLQEAVSGHSCVATASFSLDDCD